MFFYILQVFATETLLYSTNYYFESDYFFYIMFKASLSLCVREKEREQLCITTLSMSNTDILFPFVLFWKESFE